MALTDWLKAYEDGSNWRMLQFEAVQPGDEIQMEDESYRTVQRVFQDIINEELLWEVSSLDPGDGREYLRPAPLMRVALRGWKEFAHPEIRAEAWDEGYQVGRAFEGMTTMARFDVANPYRKAGS